MYEIKSWIQFSNFSYFLFFFFWLLLNFSRTNRYLYNNNRVLCVYELNQNSIQNEQFSSFSFIRIVWHFFFSSHFFIWLLWWLKYYVKLHSMNACVAVPLFLFNIREWWVIKKSNSDFALLFVKGRTYCISFNGYLMCDAVECGIFLSNQ